MKDSEIDPVPQACPIPQTSSIILWRQISTWESKNKPDSIVMSQTCPIRSHKRARLYKETILSFHLMHVYNSFRISVVLLYYKTIDISEWKVEYLRKTKSCTNRVGVIVRIRVRVRVNVWVSVKYYAIKVVPESFRIRVFLLNGTMSVEHIRGHLWHIYAIAVNQVVVATVKVSKWWPISTHPTVLHTQKEYGLIIFVLIKKKKRHKRRHGMKFLKGNNHDFTQTSCQNWKLFRFSIKVLKSLSKNV
jgi:hypothetical protein